MKEHAMPDDLSNPGRDSFRVPYAAMVMVVRGNDAWVCEMQDLSSGGCGVFRPSQCTLQEADIVQLYFYEEVGPAVRVDARVARVEDSSLGFEYHELQQVPPVRNR
ncbi:MAG: hypothetical protein CVV16_15555 [Gammaproteobacteria bacterium HGW-Gammaproteobacteria-6]|jgi:hypothetical protein|nr:MAG: hypothetical protein CVV16_15555 [Gammaproteobacteria bacterium HGW-Gammaproteobacteria-6]PKM14449.1 MAG: hypothetical protein CVV12_13930 [Gammaproteobacteria bacterium HGW-Gammaproteobacteria-2]